MQKMTNKLTIAAVSLAAVASFGVGAAALAQGGVEFNPANFDSAYTRGADGMGEGYRANQTSVDAQANRQSDNSEDTGKTAGNQGIDDAFSQMPIDGGSGTTAYNFTDNSSTGVLVSMGGNANGAANGEGLSAGAIIGEGGNSGESAGGSTNNNGNAGGNNGNGGNAGGTDTPSPSSPAIPNVEETGNSKQPTPLGDPAIIITGDNRELDSFTKSDVESPDNPDGAVKVIIRKDETSDYPLYVGQKLDAWAVFCALDAQVLFTNQDGNRRVYGWGCTRKEFEESSGVVRSTFEILEYPAVATSEMEIKVRYRFSSTGEWIYQTVSYQAEDSRYYITSEAKSDGSSPDFTMQPNSRYKAVLLRGQCDVRQRGRLDFSLVYRVVR